jgi:hypothetical protein
VNDGSCVSDVRASSDDANAARERELPPPLTPELAPGTTFERAREAGRSHLFCQAGFTTFSSPSMTTSLATGTSAANIESDRRPTACCSRVARDFFVDQFSPFVVQRSNVRAEPRAAATR